MSISNLFKTSISLIKKDKVPAYWARTIITGNPTLCETDTTDTTNTVDTGEEVAEVNRKVVQHPPEKCLAYMDSKAYKITYGDKPVWHTYVRNYKGPFPTRTRKSCIFNGRISTSSPCPMCRDQYLLAHYLNIKLLKQFISPHGGEIHDSKKTGVCQKQQENLQVAIKKAQNYGLLTFTVPHRMYNYNIYHKNK